MNGTIQLFTNITGKRITHDIVFDTLPTLGERFGYIYHAKLGDLNLIVKARTHFYVIEILEPTMDIDLKATIIFKTSAQIYKLEFSPMDELSIIIKQGNILKKFVMGVKQIE